MARIGVEQSLTDVQQELESRGYQVISLRQEQDANNCDVCVITGQDQNMMGIQETITNGSVINASGKTAEEICQQIEERISNI